MGNVPNTYQRLGEIRNRRQDRRPAAYRQPYTAYKAGADERHHIQGLMGTSVLWDTDGGSTVLPVENNLRQDDEIGSSKPPLRLRVVAQV